MEKVILKNIFTKIYPSNYYYYFFKQTDGQL